MTDILILGFAAFFAAFVDAIVGGGGLIQLPALFTVLPNAAPASLLGTSKLAGVFGTSIAAFNYTKLVRLPWLRVLPAMLMALLFSFAGAFTVTHIPPTYLRKALPFILCAIAIYTFKKKDFGTQHTPLFSGQREVWMTMLVGAVIGFYDGFFGPGTGSFLLFLFVRYFGYDFMRASAVAKVLNVACNGAALAWFSYSGNVLWKTGLAMAACAICGSLVGSRMAIHYGSLFVRKVFLFVVIVLIIKTTYSSFIL